VGVFFLAVLDSCGVPMPAAMDLLLMFVAYKSPDRAYFTAAMATIGSLGGNLTLFFAARHGVRRFFKAPAPGKPGKFRAWFDRYGLVTVFIPTLVPILPLPLKVFVVSAGVMRTPVAQFIGVIVVAAGPGRAGLPAAQRVDAGRGGAGPGAGDGPSAAAGRAAALRGARNGHAGHSRITAGPLLIGVAVTYWVNVRQLGRHHR